MFPIPIRRPFQQGIEFRNVTYRYPGTEAPALENVSFAYETGRGRIVMQARVQKETRRGGREQLVVTEIPYATSKTRILEQIVELVKKNFYNGLRFHRAEPGCTDCDFLLYESPLPGAYPWLKKGTSFDMIHVTVAIEMEAEQFLSFDENQRKLAKAQNLDVRI